MVNTWLIDFTRIHVAGLSAGLGELPDKGIGTIQGLAQYAQGWTTDAGRALEMTQGVMGRVVGREAATLAFADTYRLMAFLFFAAPIIVPFAKPAPYTQGPPPAEH